ncbi:WSCD family member CG9164 [Episyrphus balteatus]|uniref:WSCD family member CG9164 n=1 Tax=Episyrphus balteatus TaxID=286459 RepID=UPI0024868C87|nr:WSCD family member CG9164 [Episyrphus balteatus]XP_055844366.1 WSCD family member CG9164 [Episyrphus balteatus]
MALYGWRLVGVACTIVMYIAGILFLSISNVPGPHPKRVRIGRFGEIANYRTQFIGLHRKQTIHWCKELTFLHSQPTEEKDKKTRLTFRTMIKNNEKLKIDKTTNKHSNNNTTTEGSKLDPNSSSHQNSTVSGLTALASFPGSGNTWLRYLLQQSTGIFTGSIYKDYGLLKSGFPAENICNKSVLVVKTHEWGPNAWGAFSKAILLVRDPDKAILAEFNRQSGGHVGFASPDRYKRTKGRYWQQFVTNKLNGWENMNLGWARFFTGDLLIVYYDDLVANSEKILREILSFLEFPIEESLMSCALIRKEGIFRRKKRVLSFDPYSPAMRHQLDERKRKIYTLLGRYTAKTKKFND